ncbi:MAG: M6 family metalloprotease domain-containing protein, partial [Verrucomicrobiae bacterium]|nr:M6 family metalloprotease domain-containing protein [Verrucomicrobiae bacterium]
MISPRIPSVRFWFSCLLVFASTFGFLHAAHYGPEGKLIKVLDGNGQELELRVFGDEFYAVAETLDGFTVTKDLRTGQFCYARLAADGKSWISTGKQVGKGKAPAGFKKKLRLPASAIAEISQRRRDLLGYDSQGRLKPELAAKLRPRDFGYKKYSKEVEKEIKKNGYKPRNPNAPEKNPAEDTEVSQDPDVLKSASEAEESSTEESDSTLIQRGPPSTTTVGNRVGLVLLASFPDRQSDVVFSQSQVDGYFNDPDYTEFGNATSVYGYFSIQSNGKLSYNCIVTAYYTAANDRSYYVTDQGVSFGVQARWLINEGIDKLAAEGFDFTECDGNGDGVLDGVNCFYAGSNVNAWADDFGLWAHKSSSSNSNLSAGGLTSNSYQYQITDMSMADLRIGTVCHENGHMLCNFPDLYSYDGNASSLGYVSLMHSGNYAGNEFHPTNVDPYLKSAAGWATVIDVDSSSSVRASMNVDNNTFYRFKNPSDSGEYFIMELRDNTGYEGPYGGHQSSVNPLTGLVVYHAKEDGKNTYSTIVTAENPNCDYTTPYELLLLEDDLPSKTPWYDDPTPGSGDGFESGDVIDDTTTPSAKFWSVSGRTVNSGMRIHDISTPSDTITFVIGDTPTGSPTINTTETAFTPTCDNGTNAAPQSFSINNSGGGTLNYSVSDNQTWLSLSVASGSITTGSDTVNLTYATSGLSSGNHSATITITDGAATNSPYTISVNLTVNALATINLSEASLSETLVAGGTSDKIFEIRNTGGGTLSYSLSDDVDWLTLSQSSGTVAAEVDTIYATFDTGSLSPDTYNGTITVTSTSATNSPLTLPVSFTVEGTEMVVTSPNGGETFDGSTSETITWTSTLGGNVKIDLLKGGSVDRTIAASTSNDGSYSWAIPTKVGGVNCRIQITSIEQPTKIDASNADFTINPSGGTCASFETDFDGWLQGSTDDFDWTRHTGTTVSSGTGPTDGLASDGDYYLYMESSSPNYPDKTATIYKDYDFSSMAAVMMSFDYHMYGATMGTLYLEASTNGGSSWDAAIWSLSGGQGDAWRAALVDLTPYAGESSVRLRFRGVTSTSYTSDFCLDNICLFDLTNTGVQFASSSYAATEADGSATVTVDRVGDTSGAVSVQYATTNGTATAGSDYTSSSGTLNWADGDGASKTFNVSITNDTDHESLQETVILTLSNPSGTSMIGSNPINLTIEDNDNQAPSIYAGADKTIFLSEAQPWTPAETTTALWLDADDASTFTLNGGNVQEWRDKSGNARHAGQTTPSSQPADTASGLDGKHVVSFDGSSDYLNFGTGLDFMSGASHSAFIVLADVTNYSDIYGAASGGSGANSLHVGFSNSSGYRMNYWGHDYGPSVTSNFVATGSIVNYIWDVGSPKQIFANGSLEGSGHNALAPGTMSGGGRISNVVGHGYLGGKIAEIVIVSGSVSQADRELLEGYLAHKWGMEGNLPSGHPYKTAPPGGAGMYAVANLSDATASDPDGDAFTTDWDLFDGPGASVTFGDEAVVNTTATFTEEGVYKLHLTGDDTRDQTTDEVIITVGIAGLSVAIDQASISENGGTSSATLTRVSTAGDLVVNLSSDDSSEATVPASVTILDGNATANFTVTAQNDSLDDGTQTVTITATASGYPVVTDTVDVLDDEYLVSYNGNGNDGGTAPADGSNPYTSGSSVTVSGSGTLTLTGHDLSGWTTEAGGGGTSYSPGYTFAIAGDVTLYAQWSPSSYTVTFNANGGAAPSPASKSVTYNTTYGTLAAISRSGYTFMGWFTSGTGGTEITSGTTVAITAAQTLYAQWNEKPVVNAGSDQPVYLTGSDIDWTPADTNTVAWFDAADAATIAESSGAVSQWSDKSGNGNHATQGNSSNQPTYNSSDSRLNNLPTIGYDQGFKYLDTPTLTAIQNVYVVTYYDDADNSFDSHRVLFSDTGNSIKLQGSSGNDDWVAGYGFDKYKDGSTTSSDLSILPMGPTLWTAKGTASHSGKVWRLLSGKQSYQYWEYGAIGEIVLTDGAESVATVQKMEGFLAWKWGMQAKLPAAHPYSTANATSGPKKSVPSATATLAGTVTDSDDTPTYSWSDTGTGTGTGIVTFADVNDLNSDVSFSGSGTYILRLTVDDGHSPVYEEVVITVSDPTPYSIWAGGVHSEVDGNNDGIDNGLAWV